MGEWLENCRSACWVFCIILILIQLKELFNILLSYSTGFLLSLRPKEVHNADYTWKNVEIIYQKMIHGLIKVVWIFVQKTDQYSHQENIFPLYASHEYV